jgi:hypothetical protein
MINKHEKKAVSQISIITSLALLLVVFIVILLILTGRFGDFFGAIDSCEDKGGGCLSNKEDCPGRITSSSCPSKEAKYCCIPDNLGS